MIIETTNANNYIIRFPESILFVDRSKVKEVIDVKQVRPLSWRIDNPYFGKPNGANMQS